MRCSEYVYVHVAGVAVFVTRFVLAFTFTLVRVRCWFAPAYACTTFVLPACLRLHSHAERTFGPHARLHTPFTYVTFCGSSGLPVRDTAFPPAASTVGHTHAPALPHRHTAVACVPHLSPYCRTVEVLFTTAASIWTYTRACRCSSVPAAYTPFCATHTAFIAVVHRFTLKFTPHTTPLSRSRSALRSVAHTTLDYFTLVLRSSTTHLHTVAGYARFATPAPYTLPRRRSPRVLDAFTTWTDCCVWTLFAVYSAGIWIHSGPRITPSHTYYTILQFCTLPASFWKFSGCLVTGLVTLIPVYRRSVRYRCSYSPHCDLRSRALSFSHTALRYAPVRFPPHLTTHALRYPLTPPCLCYTVPRQHLHLPTHSAHTSFMPPGLRSPRSTGYLLHPFLLRSNAAPLAAFFA